VEEVVELVLAGAVQPGGELGPRQQRRLAEHQPHAQGIGPVEVVPLRNLLGVTIDRVSGDARALLVAARVVW